MANMETQISERIGAREADKCGKSIGLESERATVNKREDTTGLHPRAKSPPSELNRRDGSIGNYGDLTAG